MLIGPFLKRERVASARRRGTYFARAWAAAWAAAALVGSAGVYDALGWDRASTGGSRSFALAAFGLLVALQFVWVIALAPVLDEPAIAPGRDRKTLDSLLATRFGSAEIVLGIFAVGLFRSARVFLASAPPMVLLIALGGIDLRLVGLAVAGLAATAAALGALAVAVSAVARTAAIAASATVGLMAAWLALPVFLVVILPKAWPAGAAWVVPPALWVLDSGPVGVGMSLLGAIPRGPLVDTVPRMIALQAAGSAVLVAWAVARLRPASRAAHDAEGGLARLRVLRARWRPRPPCGDDPVLWRELYPNRGSGLAARLNERGALALWVGMIVYGTSLFAGPAFAELGRFGYRAIPGNPSVPELNPYARVLVAKLARLPIVPPEEGTARLEFNVALRQASWFFALMFFMLVAGRASESLATERERDTWLGLIATPLSGRDILRAKMIGSIYHASWLGLSMLGLWAVGLASGAIHPAGFAAAVAGLAASTWFLAALGVFAASRATARGQAYLAVLVPAMVATGLAAAPFIHPGLPGVLAAVAMPPFQAFAAPLSFEDVAALARSGVPPQLAALGVGGVWASRLVVAVWILSAAAQAAGGFLLSRAAFRGFDAAVGRPVRAAGPPLQPPGGAGAMTLPGRIQP